MNELNNLAAQVAELIPEWDVTVTEITGEPFDAELRVTHGTEPDMYVTVRHFSTESSVRGEWVLSTSNQWAPFTFIDTTNDLFTAVEVADVAEINHRFGEAV